MKHQQNQAKAMIEIWSILLRFRWRFILPAFIVMTMVMAFGMMMPRKYRAEATFDRRTDMVLTEITTRGATQSFQEPRQAIREEVAGGPALLALRPKLDAVLNEYSIGEYNDRESFYRSLGRRIIINHKHASREFDRYSVEYVGTEPRLARAIVNTLVESYIERTEKMMEERLLRSVDFFRKEVDRYRAEIEAHEEKMLSFEIEHDILLPDNPVNIQTLMSQRQMLAADLEQERETALEVIAQLKAELEKTPATAPSVVSGPNPHKKALQDELTKAQATLAHNLGVLKMTDKHPDLVALRERIEAIGLELETTEDEVVTQTRVARNPKRSEVELRLAEATALAASLGTRLDAVRKDVEKLNGKAANLYPVRSDYRRLDNAREQAKRHLGFWEDNLRRVEMSMAAETGNRGVELDFIAPCGELTRPVSPALTQVLAAALMLGLLAGALSVFFAYRTDETFVNGEEMARSFNLPLFGAVSELISKQQARVRRARNMVLYPTSALGMAAVVLAMGGMLYLNLERPEALESLTKDPIRFFTGEKNNQPGSPADGGDRAHEPSLPGIDRHAKADLDRDINNPQAMLSTADGLMDLSLTDTR